MTQPVRPQVSVTGKIGRHTHECILPRRPFSASTMRSWIMETTQTIHGFPGNTQTHVLFLTHVASRRGLSPELTTLGVHGLPQAAPRMVMSCALCQLSQGVMCFSSATSGVSLKPCPSSRCVVAAVD